MREDHTSNVDAEQREATEAAPELSRQTAVKCERELHGHAHAIVLVVDAASFMALMPSSAATLSTATPNLDVTKILVGPWRATRASLLEQPTWPLLPLASAPAVRQREAATSHLPVGPGAALPRHFCHARDGGTSLPAHQASPPKPRSTRPTAQNVICGARHAREGLVTPLWFSSL